jgi:hypothetical protein
MPGQEEIDEYQLEELGLDIYVCTNVKGAAFINTAIRAQMRRSSNDCDDSAVVILM